MYYTVEGKNITTLNKNAEKIYHRFVNDLGGFVRLQEEITRLRLQVQEHRTALRRLRKHVSDCDIAFWDELRKAWSEGLASDSPKLIQLFESSREARDAVGPAEDDYEKMEVRLGAQEYSLSGKFGDLNRSYQHFFKLQIGSTTQAPASEISYVNSMGGEEEREPRNASKLYGTNLGDGVKVGDLPTRGVIPLDSVQQGDSAPNPSPLSASKSPVWDRRDTTIITAEDAKMFADDDNFLLTVGEEKSPNIWAEPQTIMHNVKGMRELEPIPEEMEDNGTFENLFEDAGELLLLGDDSETRSTLSDYLMEFDSTPARINRWLLHKLRVSPWEVFELRREVAACWGAVPSWAQLALKLWEQDLGGFDFRETSSEEDSLDQQMPSATSPYPRPGVSRKRRKRNSLPSHQIPIRPLTKQNLDTVMNFHEGNVSVTHSAPETTTKRPPMSS